MEIQIEIFRQILFFINNLVYVVGIYTIFRWLFLSIINLGHKMKNDNR